MASNFGAKVLPEDSPAIRLLEENDTTGRGVYISPWMYPDVPGSHSLYHKRTPESSPRCLILGGKKIPTNFEFLSASFGWLGILFEKKKSDQKGQFLSGLCPKVKFLSGQVKWTLRAHFWVFFSQNLPMASFDVYAHLSLGCQNNYMLKFSAT